MNEIALVIVLASAVAHAGWNFIAKQASAGPTFNWLFDTQSVLVWLPLGIAQDLLGAVTGSRWARRRRGTATPGGTRGYGRGGVRARGRVKTLFVELTRAL